MCVQGSLNVYTISFFTETADFMAIFAERGKYANNDIV